MRWNELITENHDSLSVSCSCSVLLTAVQSVANGPLTIDGLHRGDDIYDIVVSMWSISMAVGRSGCFVPLSLTVLSHSDNV